MRFAGGAFQLNFIAPAVKDVNVAVDFADVPAKKAPRGQPPPSATSKTETPVPDSGIDGGVSSGDGATGVPSPLQE